MRASVKTSFLSRIPICVAACAALACFTTGLHAQISVGVGGAGPIDFTTPPAATEWSTRDTSGGDANTYTTPATTDAGARTNDAALITTGLSPDGDYGTGRLARHNNTAGLESVYTVPTGVPAAIIMATMQNDSGQNILSFTMSYDFNADPVIQLPAAGEQAQAPGFRVLWSLSGLPQTWTVITNISGVTNAGNVSATLQVDGWAAGTKMYILWYDDNANSNPDATNTIDNFQISGVVNGLPPCPGITSDPANIVRQQCLDAAASFSITATGAIAGVQWYRQESGGGGFNPIVGANGNTYSFTGYTVAGDSGAQFRAVVTNSAGCSVTSLVATLTVVADVTPPFPVAALTYDVRTTRAANTLTNITILFSESINTNNPDLWTNWILTDTNTATQVALFGQIYLNSTTVLLETDASQGGLLDPSHGYTLELSAVFDTCNNLEMALTNIAVKSFSKTILERDASTIWRYNQDNVNLGTAWRASVYDDSTWATGAAMFDAKTGAGFAGSCSARTTIAGEPIRTCLSLSNATLTAEIPTYYFRKQFSYSGDTDVVLQLRSILDDGMVVYLNGTEISRLGMASGTVTFTTAANRTVGDGARETNYVAATLINGVNTIAVEVHNVNLTGSDITFGLAVDAISATPSAVQPVMHISQNGGVSTITWTPPTGVLQRSLDISSPANWVTIPGASSPFITNAPPAIQFFRVSP